MVRPADVERWLDELGLSPLARADRDGVTSWDLRLDGRRRFDLPITLILDPALALICWVHFAPPIGDAFRKSYRRLLRWNDEFPFAKFSLAEDERPVLATRAADPRRRSRRARARARPLARDQRPAPRGVGGWLWIGGRIPDMSERSSRGEALIARYADRMPELLDEPQAGRPARGRTGGTIGR